jgi:23S rRNA U2552 (ribose-2'-O)-methylase RlmE/FtsJ
MHSEIYNHSFNAEYLVDTNLSRPDLDLDFELSQTLSGSIWKTIPQGHKWLHYFPIYDQEFSHLRGKNIQILEIGVYRGASLKLWKKFFGENARIIGIDIDQNCKQFDQSIKNIHVEIGSQADPVFLKTLIDKYGPFDLIIDDGSHVVSHQLASFNALFLEGLKNSGTYFIEDLEGNYWDNGLKDRKHTTVDLIKLLMDLQNCIYLNSSYGKFLLNSGQTQNNFIVPKIATLVQKISTYRGVAVVTKKNQIPPLGIHL